MIRRTLLTFLVLLLAAGLAACGGGGGGDDAAADRSDDDESSTDDSTGSSDTLPTAEDEVAEDAGEAGAAAGDEAGGDAGDDEADPAPGQPGSVATELGVDRTFTGEGSDELCDAMDDLSAASPDLGQAEFADKMAAVTPPPEIAAEWETMYTGLKAIASDPSGEALSSMSQAEVDEWATANSVVAAYLGDVCGMAG